MEISLNKINIVDNIMAEEIKEMPNINYYSAPIIEINSSLENNKRNLESNLIEINIPPSEDTSQNQKNKYYEDQIIYKSTYFSKKIKSNSNNINNYNENHIQHVVKLTQRKKRNSFIFGYERKKFD